MALLAAVTMTTALGLPVIDALVTANATANAAPAAPPTNVLRLNVTAATTSSASGGPHAGSHVPQYKWLIQQDKTGDPNQPSGPTAANDGTIGCTGGVCTLSSPSAPFLYTAGSLSADVGVGVTGANMAPGATIVSVSDARNVTLSAGAYTGPSVAGTYLFSILRPDPCHPVTPDTPQGNVNFPAGCNWPSIHLSSHAPVVTQGEQTDWGTSQTLSGLLQSGPRKGTRCALNVTSRGCNLSLPDGKYFVSVTADGYEIGGTSFTVPAPADAGRRFATVKVGLNPGPLTLGTMKILVFDDMASTASNYEATTESGMAGFTAQLADFTGNPVSQDYFGNPLCTTYKTDANGHTTVDAKGSPMVVHLGGQCVSAHDPTNANNPENDGLITIPNLAPGRYGASVIPPDKGWIQTTTLEGSHDFDVWLTGNDSGLDTEMVAGGEQVPFVHFGFARAAMTDNSPTNPAAYATAGCRILPLSPADGVPPSGDIRAQLTAAMLPCQGNHLTPRVDPGLPGQQPTPDGSLQADSWRYPYDPAVHPSPPTGEVTGRVVSEEPYVPGVGGLNGVGGANGQAGLKLDNRPIADAWIAMADLNNGDQTAIVAPAKSDGTFDIKNVPDGTYNMSWWDWNQDFAFDQYQVTIANGEVANQAAIPLLGWFTRIEGHVFIDKNGNGKQDPGEAGVPDFLMQILNRTNNAEEGGQNVASTNDSGFYQFKEAYPLGNDLVLQFFNTRFKTTGVTCQADNDPQQHTLLTPAVDLTTLNIIGLNGFCDIGVQPYNIDPTANDNGGIVATAMYHSFRTETSQDQAFTTPFDTGQPGVRFELWQPRPDPKGNGTYQTCAAPLPAPLPNAAGPYQPCPNGADGSLVRDPVQWDTANAGQLSVYYSEHYGRPGQNQYSQPGCVPRGADGQVLDSTVQESIKPGGDCIEASLQGTSFGFGADGNPIDPMLYNPPASQPPLDPGTATGPYANLADPYPGLNAYCNALNPTPPAPGTPPNGAECGPHGVQVVDGNYAMTPPGPGDYIVHAVVPNDMFGKPLYKWATEATNNTYEGPGWIPPNASGPVTWPVIPIGPPSNAGPQEPGYSITPSTSSPSPSAKCVGSQLLINNTDPNKPNFVSNPSWVDYWSNTAHNAGAVHGGPFEGQLRPKCDTKLLHVQNGQSVAPNFHIFTDVPLATTFQGYAVDDISVSTNKLSTAAGEVAGIPNMPIGIYDWTGRQISTVNTDYNGLYEVMLPSTNTFNCNTVAGPCPGVYRFVGNDPGQPSAPNLNFNPGYITIAATFQAWPNVYSPSDVAPTRNVVAFEGNGQQLSAVAVCATPASQPQLFSVSHPFWKSNRSDTNTLTINGVGFGTTAPSTAGQPDAGVTLRNLDTGARLATLNVRSWSDTQIQVNGMNRVPPGPYQLMIQNGSGLQLPSGLTFHVIGTGYSPALYEVGTFRTGILNANGTPAGTPIADNNTTLFNPNAPAFLPPNAFPGDGKVKGAVQRSLESAAKSWLANKTANAQTLVVVYPNFQRDPTTGRYGGVAWDPLTAYFENIVIHSPTMLQGTGPGGLYRNADGVTVAVPGSTLDGRFFNAATSGPVTTSDTFPTTEPWASDWDQLVGNIIAAQSVANGGLQAAGEVVFVLGNRGWYARGANGYRPSVDGFTITGGDQKSFPGNISEVGGASTGGPPDETFSQDIQGGAIFLNAYAEHFQISNNLVQSNSGTYGAIRSGSPQVDPADGDPNAHNSDLHLHHNRIIANGGTNLAGAVGLFRGTDHYRIDNNVVCGNLSAEYGAGISHFGYSPGGEIDHNKIMLNQAIDEGGGIMMAGEPPINPITSTPDPSRLSMGAGAASIHDNYIGDNLSYDDGGGVRFLEAGNFPFNVSNNMITDNASAHEGGGVAIDNAPNVLLVNNTIANNISTATATTSTGQPNPAGLSSAHNSAQLQAFLLGKTTIAQDQPDGTVAQVSCAQVSSAAACAALANIPFSKPLIFNDILWGNLAGTWDSLHSTVTGIGLAQNLQNDPVQCPAPAAPCVAPSWDPAVNHWDIGVADGSDTTTRLEPINSLLNSTQGWSGTGPGDVLNVDPNFVQSYTIAIQSNPYRLQPRFRPSTLITINLPANVLGNYRIQAPSGATGIGGFKATAPSGDTVTRPARDIDGQYRPACPPVTPPCPDAGAHQLTPYVWPPGVVPVVFRATPGVGPPGVVPVVFRATFALAAGSEAKGVAAGAIAKPSPAPATHPLVRTPPPAGASRVPTAPPPGSVANTAAIGRPDEAGNTAVVQVPGPRPPINGVAQAQPGPQSAAAPMPGGVTGGGHFKVPWLHHVYHRPGRSLASRLFDFVTSPAGVLVALAMLAAAAWAGRRRRRRRTPPEAVGQAPGSSAPPPLAPPQTNRPLVLAEKGEGHGA
jgi:SdrD B-like domain